MVYYAGGGGGRNDVGDGYKTGDYGHGAARDSSSEEEVEGVTMTAATGHQDGGDGVVILRCDATIMFAETTGSVTSSEITVSSTTYHLFTFSGAGTITFLPVNGVIIYKNPALSTTAPVLRLLEVELSLGGTVLTNTDLTTALSSTESGYPASHCIDGDVSTTDDYCSTDSSDSDPRLTVATTDNKLFNKVKITNTVGDAENIFSFVISLYRAGALVKTRVFTNPSSIVCTLCIRILHQSASGLLGVLIYVCIYQGSKSLC